MKIKKYCTSLAIVLSMLLGVGVASAGMPAEPPGQGGRDVIPNAGAICGDTVVAGQSTSCMIDLFPADELADACNLRCKTDGDLMITTPGCVMGDGELTDQGFVDYLLRNCDKNERALLRKASSAVLALSAALSGKERQAITAAGYLCEYADRYELLDMVDKLKVDVSHEFDSPPVDLGKDAKDLAGRITSDPTYCFYL